MGLFLYLGSCLGYNSIMQNADGDTVDLYIPRKCSYTNRLITAKDHASVQINIGEVDENGYYTGQNKTFVLCGFLRGRGEGDLAVNCLAQTAGLISKVVP